MQTARPTHEQLEGATVQRTRCYTTVNWDYPPSPAAHHNALLSRGALHSRFLRIAYSSTTVPTLCPFDTHLVPTTPYPIPRSCGHVRPRSANLPSHSLKRRKPQWPKPPHYHASLLRSPLSHRKGLFRAVLAPNKAVDFFRWDILFGPGVSLSAPRLEHGRTRSSNVDACASLHIAECVLEPYEAAAGFFGWHGLGLDAIRRVHGSCDEDECCWSEVIDEAAVEEGRARWARVAEELVGPPGLVLQWIVDKGKVTVPAHKDGADARVSSMRRQEIRWDPDIGYSPGCSSRPTSASEKRRPLPSCSTATLSRSVPDSRLELKTDSPSAWLYGHSPTHHVPSFRFPLPPSAQYGPPPLQFSPYFPGGRVTSAQGHGYWYGAQPTGESTVFSWPIAILHRLCFLLCFFPCMMLTVYCPVRSQVHPPWIVTRTSPNHIRLIHTVLLALSHPRLCIHPSLLDTLPSQVWVGTSTDQAPTVIKRPRQIMVTNQRRQRRIQILPRIHPLVHQQRHIV